MKTHGLPWIAAVSALLAFSTGAAALGALENPQPGGTEAGIGVISGWHCTSKNIEVRIDGVSGGLAGAGTQRGDTAGVCGGRVDTGFSFLFNYALLRGGTHKVEVFADGVPFGAASFQAGYLGAEFLKGLSTAHRVTDFPVKGVGARVLWAESKQGFVISGVDQLTSGPLVGSYTVRNVWMIDSDGFVASTLAPGYTVSGTWAFRADGTMTVTLTLTGNGQAQTESLSGTYSDFGWYISDNGATDLVIERGDTLTLLTFGPMDASTWATVAFTMSRNLTAATAESAAADMAPAAAGPGGVLRALGEAIRRVQ
jgi:hypothetical protein